MSQILPHPFVLQTQGSVAVLLAPHPRRVFADFKQYVSEANEKAIEDLLQTYHIKQGNHQLFLENVIVGCHD